MWLYLTFGQTDKVNLEKDSKKTFFLNISAPPSPYIFAERVGSIRPKHGCKKEQTRRRCLCYFQACCANFLPVYTVFLHFAVKNDIYDE